MATFLFNVCSLCSNMASLWLEFLHVSQDITNPLWKRMENPFYKGFKSFKLILFQNESTPSKLKFFSLKKIHLFFTLLGSKLRNKIHIKINGDVLSYFLIKQDILFTVLELAVGLCFPHLEK